VSAKIKVEKPLVVLHGDEMAQIAFERILEQVRAHPSRYRFDRGRFVC
jgi:hypothetical protein